jgi:hypothetical protein
MLALTPTALLILAQTSVIIAARLGIAIAQTTIVIAARRLIPLRYKRLGIHGSAGSGLDTRRIFLDKACPRSN